MLLSLVLAAPALGQTSTAPVTLSGTVVDSVNHRPIARVLVESPTGGPAVLTDNSGRFSFPAVPLSNVQLRYRRPGYFDAFSGQTTATRNVMLTAETADQTVSLEPAAALHGQVQVPDGESANGIRVDLLQAKVDNGRRRWQKRQTVAARSDGSFAFEELQPGSYLVHADGALDPAPLAAGPRVRSGYAPVFAPGTGDLDAATVTTLAPGQTGEVSIRLERTVYYPVRIGVAGERAQNFEIRGNGFTQWSATYAREDNAVETVLPSGSYTLHASAGGRQPASGDLPFHVDGAPLSGPTITVLPWVAIPFQTTVIGAPTGPANRTGVAPRMSRLRFAPTSSLDGTIISVQVGIEGAEQSAPVQHAVVPGRYWVSAMPDTGYVASLTSEGTNLLEQPLSILPGTSPTVSAVIRLDTGTLTVTRAGAVAAEPCAIQLIPLDESGASFSPEPVSVGTAETQAVIGGIAPGDYLVLATRRRANIAFREEGVLQQLQGARVTIAPGSSAQVTISTFSTPPAGATGEQ